MLWTGTTLPLPFARLTIQTDAFEGYICITKFFAYFVRPELSCNFQILDTEILCISLNFEFKILKQNTFTEDVLKTGYINWISMAQALRNKNIFATGHEQYFILCTYFIYLVYTRRQQYVSKSAQNTFSQESFSCACMFLLAHQLVILDNLPFYAVLRFVWS
jgi:hypothetical protein